VTERCRVLSAALLALLLSSGCASLPVAQFATPPRVVVLTPVDGIPIRSRDILPLADARDDDEAARALALGRLRDDFAGELRQDGLDVEAGTSPVPTGKRPDFARAAEIGRAAHADVAVVTELVAYGNIRRSWLWVLAAQGLAAGIGHGVVVAKATGNPTYGWWAGAGEFLLETATWVGGAVVGSRGLDPVLLRVWLVRASDGAVVGRWTREGMRPFRRWFRRQGEPPRDVRLRQVADQVFARLAPRIGRRLGAPSRNSGTAPPRVSNPPPR
jgi:hypothetical protein